MTSSQASFRSTLVRSVLSAMGIGAPIVAPQLRAPLFTLLAFGAAGTVLLLLPAIALAIGLRRITRNENGTLDAELEADAREYSFVRLV